MKNVDPKGTGVPFRHAFDSMTDLVFIKDLQNRYVYCNPAYAAFFSKTVEDVIGKTDEDIHEPEDVEAFGATDKLLISGASECSIVERWVELSGGSRFIVTEKTLVRDDDGNVTGIFGIAKDRTRTRTLQKELESSEQRFRNMFDEHTAMMLLFDPADGRIVDANPAACMFFGYSREGFRSKHVSDISTMPDETRKKTIDSIFKNTLNHFITTDRLADGSLRDVEIYASPITNFSGEHLLFAILHDVTDRIRVEQELKNLNIDLEQRVIKETMERRQQEQILVQQSKMAAMGEMIAAIAHQWRQPLNVLSLAVQDILDEHQFGTLTDEYLHHNQELMLKQISHMNDTIEGFRKLLEPSRQRSRFCVRTITTEALDLFASQYAANNIHFDLACVPDTALPPQDKSDADASTHSFCSRENTKCTGACETSPVMVEGYPNEMKQVILNIVNNSRDAIMEGRKTERIPADQMGLINIVIQTTNDEVVITISDNAGGIPENIIDRVFDPYFTTKAEGIGTGIGLYMSKTIVETHMAGKLDVSNTDDGARFTITLKTSKPTTA